MQPRRLRLAPLGRPLDYVAVQIGAVGACSRAPGTPLDCCAGRRLAVSRRAGCSVQLAHTHINMCINKGLRRRFAPPPATLTCAIYYSRQMYTDTQGKSPILAGNQVLLYSQNWKPNLTTI